MKCMYATAESLNSCVYCRVPAALLRILLLLCRAIPLQVTRVLYVCIVHDAHLWRLG